MLHKCSRSRQAPSGGTESRRRKLPGRVCKHGIWNLENMVFDGLVEDEVYEFLFVFAPIRFKGGTGSPGRPLAIR